MICASTCSNYGKMKDPSQYVDENSDLTPVSLYARTKVELERAILDPSKTKKLCATSLRFATVFGVSPRMRFDLTVNEFTMEMLTRKSLKVFGERFWRPYVHVRDAARGILAVLEAEPGKVACRVFNVGDTGQNFTKKQLVELIAAQAPEAVVEYVEKGEDPRDYRVCFDRIKQELGFSITRTVADGIAEVAQLVKSGVITDFQNPEYRN
jgi:nucleoside-diphosphate-sugar epimerase